MDGHLGIWAGMQVCRVWGWTESMQEGRWGYIVIDMGVTRGYFFPYLYPYPHIPLPVNVGMG
jgi:hypothetical protein